MDGEVEKWRAGQVVSWRGRGMAWGWRGVGRERWWIGGTAGVWRGVGRERWWIGGTVSLKCEANHSCFYRVKRPSGARKPHRSFRLLVTGLQGCRAGRAAGLLELLKRLAPSRLLVFGL